MYVKHPLSLRNVRGLLAERGIEICHETARFWWFRRRERATLRVGRMKTLQKFAAVHARTVS